MLAELPPDIEVRRLPPATHPETSPRWRGRAERWLGVRSPWARWWVAGSVELGAAAGADADLVYVWMQPYDSAEAGAALSRTLDRPWVADLGDPWALDEMMVYPSAFHRQRERRRMRDLLGTAAAVVLSTPEAVERVLAAFPELADRPVVAIPNGYDPQDFAKPVERVNDGIFRLVHTGSLHTELGLEHRRWLPLRRVLRGDVPGIDILTRSHVYLLGAIDLLLERDPSLAGALELHLAGVLTPADEEAARRSPLVKLHGYLSHSESIGLLRRADLLFLPMQNLPIGVRATIVPGKTYEYLASGTPILAALPDGDARELLIEAGNAIVLRPDDVTGMADAIQEQVGRWQRGIEPPSAPADVVRRFEYRSLAGKLAEVFDEVLERDRRSAT